MLLKFPKSDRSVAGAVNSELVAIVRLVVEAILLIAVLPLLTTLAKALAPVNVPLRVVRLL